MALVVGALCGLLTLGQGCDTDYEDPDFCDSARALDGGSFGLRAIRRPGFAGFDSSDEGSWDDSVSSSQVRAHRTEIDRSSEEEM